MKEGKKHPPSHLLVSCLALQELPSQGNRPWVCNIFSARPHRGVQGASKDGWDPGALLMPGARTAVEVKSLC